MTVVGGSTDHLIVDRLGNVQADAVLEVRTLAGVTVTDLTPPTGWTGQAFPAGKARADGDGYFKFVVPDVTGPVQVRTAAHTEGTKEFAAGPWLDVSGQVVPGSEVDQRLAAMATDADIAAAVAAQAAVDSNTYVPREGTTIYAKLHGVVADGTTDDTANAQAALDAALPGDVVVFPSGTTKITAALYYGTGVTIRAAIGGQVTQATNGLPALVQKNYNSTLYGGSPSGHTVIRDIKINAPAVAGSHGIIMRDYYSRIINVQVAGGDRAFYLTAKDDAGTPVGGTLVENRISGCKATGYVGYGFYLGDADNNKLTDGFLTDCIASGASGSTAHVYIGSSAGWQVRGIHTYGLTSGHSIHAHAAFQTIIDGIYVETWTSAGIALTSAQQAVTLSNLLLRAPGVANNGAVYITRSGAFTFLNVLATNVHVTQNNDVAVTAFNTVSSDITLRVAGFAASGTYVSRVAGVEKADITLLNGWVAFGAPYDTPGARLTTDGYVVMVGAIKSGTTTSGTRLGTLPVGYRPAFRHRYPALNAGGSPTDIYVDTDGGIFLAASSGNILVSFDGITFPAA